MDTKRFQLGFNGANVYLNGKMVFTVPIKRSGIDVVTVAGILKADDGGRRPTTICVGTGACCYGHLYMLEAYGDDAEFVLAKIFSVDTNVMDILPVSVNYKKAGFANEDGVLVVGYGCAGAGVRLISTYYPKSVDVVSTQDARNSRNRHYFCVDQAAGTIGDDTTNLNPLLEAVGVDVGESIKLLANYHSMRYHTPEPF